MKSALRRAALPLALLLASTFGTAAELHGQSAPVPLAQLLSGGTLIFVLGLLAVLAVAAVVLLRSRRWAPSGRVHDSRSSDPSEADAPLVFPILPSDPVEVLPRSHAPRTPASPPPPPAPRPPQSAAPPELPVRPAPEIPAADGPEPALPPPGLTETFGSGATPVPARQEEPGSLPEPPVWPAPVVPEPVPANGHELFEGQTIRYYRPVEETVQFLPGRLEVVGGDDRGQDIRFVRTWGSIPEITFGRSSGPPHRHVQLRARTASREHARLRFVEGEWKIANLSRTNPLVINGEELAGQEEVRTLQDGDLIEMGEVVFRFRER